jgi:hypothetical protein
VLAALNLPHVRTFDPGHESQGLLGDAIFGPGCADCRPEGECWRCIERFGARWSSSLDGTLLHSQSVELEIDLNHVIFNSYGARIADRDCV